MKDCVRFSFFAAMKLTLKNCLAIVMAIVPLGCTQSLSPLGIRRGERCNRGADSPAPDTLIVTDTLPPLFEGAEKEDPQAPPPSVYICGVPGSADAIWVMKDGVKLREIPISESSSASADPDTHFLFSDSLYTTITSRGTTSVALNGQRLFSYNASEYIVSLCPSRQGLWTLGNDRDGDGFSLRLDGEIEYSSQSGSASPLYFDCGQMCFNYRVSLGDYESVYLVRDLSSNPVSPRYGGRVMDAALCGGQLYVVEAFPGSYAVWSSDKYREITPPSGFGSAGARLYRCGENTCAAVLNLIGGATGMPLDLIVEEGEDLILRGGGSASYHYYSDGRSAHLATGRFRDALSVCWNGEEVELQGVVVEGERCATIFDGQLYIALSSVAGGNPCVLHAGKMSELKFSGTLTGIDVSPPS